MNNISICILLISLQSLYSCGQEKKKNSSIDLNEQIGNQIFYALKSVDENEFLKIIPTKQEYIDYYCFYTDSNKREEIRMQLEINTDLEQNLTDIIKLYRKAILRGNEIGIDWKNIILKDVTYDKSTSSDGRPYIKGEISFKDDKAHYIIKFDECVQLKTRVAVTYLFTPFIDTTPINQSKCASYKDNYIKKCVEAVKQSPGKPSIPFEEYCLCSFNKIIMEDNCQDILSSKSPHIFAGDCFK